MNIKDSYYYAFYKFYKLFLFFEKASSLTKAKAMFCVGCLEIWCAFAIFNYWDVILKQHSHLSSMAIKIVTIFIPLVVIHWIVFYRDDKWMNYVTRFDELPYGRNIKGTWMVIAFVIFIFANFLFSFYLNPPPGGFKQG